MFNLVCEALLTLWLFLYLPRLPSSSLYLAEKIWLATWIISQSLCFVYLLAAAGIAYHKPALLLNRRWQKKAFQTYSLLMTCQFIIFFSVLFVDISRFFYEIIGLEFNEKLPINDPERSLNLIVRVAQAFSVMFLYCFGRIYYTQLMQKRAREREATRVTDMFKKAKVSTWEENQLLPDEERCMEDICAFC